MSVASTELTKVLRCLKCYRMSRWTFSILYSVWFDGCAFSSVLFM